ncbi:unnamed protein product, partial [Lampetra planeri]
NLKLSRCSARSRSISKWEKNDSSHRLAAEAALAAARASLRAPQSSREPSRCEEQPVPAELPSGQRPHCVRVAAAGGCCGQEGDISPPMAAELSCSPGFITAPQQRSPTPQTPSFLSDIDAFVNQFLEPGTGEPTDPVPVETSNQSDKAEERYVPRQEWKIHLTPVPAELRERQAVPRDLVHNSSMHFTFNKFWKRYGKFARHLMKVMLRRYANQPTPPSSVDEAFAVGVHPSFSHFIQYLLDPQTEKEMPFNEHWRQVYRLCHPCQIQYDFVGHLETAEEDAEHLLRQLRVDNVVEFPTSHRNLTASSWEADWFSAGPL